MRLVVEATLLVVLAVVLGLAEVRPVAIVAAMGCAWLIVAIVEWVVLRDVPHYSSGAQPRYELPQGQLPPPRPVEQIAPYPTARRIDAPTWIGTATPAEDGDEWPVPAVPYESAVEVAAGRAPESGLEVEPDEEGDAEDVAVAEAPAFSPPGAASDPWYVQELPAEPLAAAPQARQALHRIDPLAVPAGRRLFRRRPDVPESPVVEFPVLPRHARLPSQAR